MRSTATRRREVAMNAEIHPIKEADPVKTRAETALAANFAAAKTYAIGAHPSDVIFSHDQEGKTLYVFGHELTQFF